MTATHSTSAPAATEGGPAWRHATKANFMRPHDIAAGVSAIGPLPRSDSRNV